jgi:hypothetical protein
VIPLEEETIMLKTISAALLAVSVLAAPALAAGATKQVPAVKTEQVKTSKSEQAKTVAVNTRKTGSLNANARMGRHHHRHFVHHRSHKHIGALKTHKFSKVSTKHIARVTKRG